MKSDVQILSEEIEEYEKVFANLRIHTPIDEVKLAIITRLYQHLTLEELEVVEAQQEAIFARNKKAYIHY